MSLPNPNPIPDVTLTAGKRKHDEKEVTGEDGALKKKHCVNSTTTCTKNENSATKDRCARCNRKLSLVDQAQQCKCKHFYCAKHRFGVRLDLFKEDQVDGHACRFDYGGENAHRLDVAMNKVLSNRGLENKI